MAAQLKSDGGYFGVHTVRAGDFKRLVDRCENPPKASAALKAFVAEGRVMVKKR